MIPSFEISARRAAPLVLVVLACGVMFLQESTNHYRENGRLGATVPHLQEEILNGTAPVPWVYRQAVPRIRQAMQRVGVQPGHAAVLVDGVFFLLGITAVVTVGRYACRETIRDADPAIPDALSTVAPVVFTMAAVASYGYGKPESVAMVASMTAVIACLVWDRPGAAALLAAASVGFRPMVPVFLGGALVLAGLVLRNRFPDRRAVMPWTRLVGVGGGAAGVGITYLLLSRHVWFPDRVPYYEAYPMYALELNLIGNVTEPTRWPGLMLWVGVVALLGYWGRRAWRGARRERSPSSGAGRLPVALVQGVVVLFGGSWLLAIGVLGKLDEIRLMMPLVPSLLLLAAGRWRP